VETEILNKKVGYALIAVSLLAASSVKSSSIQDIGGSCAKSTDVINASSSVAVKAPWNEEVNISCFSGYNLIIFERNRVSVGCSSLQGEEHPTPCFFSSSMGEGESAIKVVVLKRDGDLPFEALKGQGFPGFTQLTCRINGIRIEVLFLAKFVVAAQSRSGIWLLPRALLSRTT
jgi:hypothetical protein